MHCVMVSGVPVMVTVRSVEFGNISEATWMEAPLISRISLIFDPPLPMIEPHWVAGTINLKTSGGINPPQLPFWRSKYYDEGRASEKWTKRTTDNRVSMSVHTSWTLAVINWNALNMEFNVPVTVTIRSEDDPSDIWIFEPDWKQNFENWEQRGRRDQSRGQKITCSRNCRTSSPFLPIILPTSYEMIKNEWKL